MSSTETTDDAGNPLPLSASAGEAPDAARIALGDALRLVAQRRRDGLDILQPELGQEFYVDFGGAENCIRAQRPEVQRRTIARIEVLMNNSFQRIDLALRSSALQ
ncbi:MAG: hypothetical protein WCS85_04730 [Candidatus Peribacteraceae bacterium]|jgi:hypothetical protein